MTTKEILSYILEVLGRTKGDDLERANRAFGRMTEAELDRQWGQSGMTARQVWDGYKADRAKWTEAEQWVETQIKTR